MESVVSNYASALYSLLEASERGSYLSAIQSIGDDFEKEKRFFSLLCSYSVSQEEKEKILDRVYGRIPLKHLLPFLKLLCRKHIISHFCGVLEAFASLCHEADAIKEGIVYSVSPLEKGQLRRIEEALGEKNGCRVVLKNVVDPSLLGGVKVALDGKVYDGSIKGRLAELKKQLKGDAPYEN